MIEADYVIVGSGPAGCALAASLCAASTDPALRVVVLERGTALSGAQGIYYSPNNIPRRSQRLEEGNPYRVVFRLSRESCRRAGRSARE